MKSRRNILKPRSNLRFVLALSGTALLIALITACPTSTPFGNPAIKVTINSVDVLNGDTRDLGDVAAGLEGTALVFTVENTGVADLEIPNGAIVIGTDSSMFRIDVQLPDTIAAGSSRTFEVVFVPSGAAGAKSATIIIDSNAYNLTTAFSITVTGICTVEVPTTDPTLVISSTAASITNVSPIPVIFTFSEAVTGFTVTDIIVTNGTAGTPITSDNIVYTSNVSPGGDGLVSINVSAAAAQSIASNLSSEAAFAFTFIYDNTAPSISSITTTATNPTNAPVPLSIVFSEAISGFTVDDLSVVNGDASVLVNTDDTIFTTTITPTGDPVDITVDIPLDAAFDGAGNGNTTAAQFAITYDSAVPTVVISSGVSGRTNLSSIPITITFSEVVNGFLSGSIDVVNGSIGGLTTSDNMVFTTDVSLSSEGEVTVDIPADSATSADNGRGNPAANQFSIIYDITGPSTVISNLASDPTNDDPIQVTVTFDEVVTGFDETDVIVVNGTPGVPQSSDGGVTYVTGVVPDGDGLVTVNIGGGVAVDLAGNGNTAASQYVVTYDGTAPGVTVSSAELSWTNASPILVQIAFTEAVTGFTISDIVVGNGTAGAPTTSDGISYTSAITPGIDGFVYVDIYDGVATDIAGNGNSGSEQFSIVYDSTPPAAPTLIPVGPDPGTEVAPLLNWDDMGAIASYHFQLDNDADFTSPIYDEVVEVSIFTAASLVQGTYYWHVSAIDHAGNEGAYCIADDFVILPSPDAVLSTFSFLASNNGGLSSDIVGGVNLYNNTVNLIVPNGADVTSLVASYTTAGQTVKVGAATQISGTSANNFTSPVLYTVTAANGTYQVFEVTVYEATGTGWSKTYGGDGIDIATSIIETSDGGYLSSGYTASYASDIYDYWILKLTSTGAVTWEKRFDPGATTGGSDVCNSAVETAQGDFIIAGTKDSDSTARDGWVLKLSSTGDILWQKMFYGNDGDRFYSLSKTAAGNFVISGDTKSFRFSGNYRTDGWIVEFDTNGNILWKRHYGGAADAWRMLYGTKEIPGGGFYSVGYSAINSSGGYDAWVNKLDSSGVEIWMKNVGGESHEYANGVLPLSNGVLVLGYTASFGIGAPNNSIWMFELDGDGVIVWQKTYGGIYVDSTSPDSIWITSDGGYIVGSSTMSYGTGSPDHSDGLVFKTNSVGEIEWQKIYGGPNSDTIRSIIQTSDGGFAAAGSYKTSDTDSDIWVIKISHGGLDDFGTPVSITVEDSSAVVKEVGELSAPITMTPSNTSVTAQNTSATVVDLY